MWYFETQIKYYKKSNRFNQIVSLENLKKKMGGLSDFLVVAGAGGAFSWTHHRYHPGPHVPCNILVISLTNVDLAPFLFL